MERSLFCQNYLPAETRTFLGEGTARILLRFEDFVVGRQCQGANGLGQRVIATAYVERPDFAFQVLRRGTGLGVLFRVTHEWTKYPFTAGSTAVWLPVFKLMARAIFNQFTRTNVVSALTKNRELSLWPGSCSVAKTSKPNLRLRSISKPLRILSIPLNPASIRSTSTS